MVKKALILGAIFVLVIFGKYLYQKPKFINGEIAPNFSMQMIDGQKRILSDFKGKFVLLDFWGSWCPPCRKENPDLVKLYQKYKDQDFEIVSIGVETRKERWIAAIEKDGLVWPNHFSDFKRFDSEPVRLYGVKEIPTKYLIDKDGMIIGINQTIEQIDMILSKRL